MRPWSQCALAITILIAAVPALTLAQTFQRPGTAPPKSAPSASTSSVSPVAAQKATSAKLRRERVASAEEQALIAIREDAVQRVETLMRQAAQTPEGPARAAILKQVVEIKLDSEIRFLETKAAFARGRGDVATASRIEDVIAARRAPPAVRHGANSATPSGPGAKGGRP
jgi:hypothetical protein